MNLYKTLWLLISVVALMAPREAFANEECERSIASGQAAARAGNYAEARGIYERSYRQCGDPVALVHIAKAFQDEGKLREALDYAERFLAETDETHPLHEALTQAAAELREKVGTDESEDGSNRNSMSRSIEAVDHLRPIEHRLNSAQPFSILDRPLAMSSGGIDASFLFFTDTSDVFALRLEPHIEHQINDRFGVIAAIPLTQLISTTDDVDGSSALGNLDVGGFYLHALGDDTDLVARGSVVIPTASGDDLLVNALGAPTRIADLVLAVPDLVVLRTTASVVHYLSSRLMLRADLGFDTPLFATGDGEIDDRKPVVHISAGASYGHRTRLVAELVNVTSLESTNQQDAFHQLGAGISHHVGQGAVRAGVSVLIDAFLDDSQQESISINLGYARRY